MSDKPESDHFQFKAHKMPEKSVLFDRVIPATFIVLAVIMALLVLFALGVLLGVIPWL